MERYMTEAYSGRAFIELLQNADDANASTIKVVQLNNLVFIANNGNVFNNKDIQAICRSGSSNKKRGETIGYRGIGFKCTTSISNEILIYSDNTFFTFSKSYCARLLNKTEEQIPTVRIPFLVFEPDQIIVKQVEKLVEEGFKTIFCFIDANIDLFKEELEEFDKNSLLFLNHINNCIINIEDIQNSYAIERHLYNNHIIIHFLDEVTSNRSWLIVKRKHAAIALEMRNDIIVPCEKKEALYHCYLPTLDKSAYACKINADFSTDPSRKHIVMDQHTKKALKDVSELIFDLISNCLSGNNIVSFKNLLLIFDNELSFSKINLTLTDLLLAIFKKRQWIATNGKAQISGSEYKCFPSSFSETDVMLIRKYSSDVNSVSLSNIIYENINHVDRFLSKFSDLFFSNEDLYQLSLDKQLLNNLNLNTQGRIILAATYACINDQNKDIKAILFPSSKNELFTVKQLKINEISPNREIVNFLLNELLPSQIDWFEKSTGIKIKNKIKSDQSEHSFNKVNNNYNSTRSLNSKISPYISKWRNAEEKCMELEELMGNKVKDVSIRNEGYDVYSITENGEERHIEVKSVNKGWDFSLTNNEYTAAMQYGESYFICLLYESEDKLKVRYIQNPLINAKFEKRIRQWEWVCREFISDEIEFEVR